MRHKPTETLTAYELYLQASAVCRRGPAGNDTALRLLWRAIELDPELGVAYALSARCLHLRRLMGWSPPEDPRLYNAVRLAHRAVEVDASDPEVLWMSGVAIANVDGNLRDGRYLVDQSLAINPNNAGAWIGSSFMHARSGDPATALEHFRHAQQLNGENDSKHHLWHAAAMAYFVAGRHEEADLATDKALAQLPTFPGSLKLKVATSGLLGRIDVAHQTAQRLAAVNPDVTIARMRTYWQLWGTSTQDAVAAMLKGWRRAGMPDG